MHGSKTYWFAKLLFAVSFIGATSLIAQAPHAFTLSGDVEGTHDPSIMRQGNHWYVFATGLAPGGGQIPIRCSDDLEHWKICGHVFDTLPVWISKESPGTKELWAPDISYAHGQFRLYYAYSLFGKNTSGIGLATNKTLDPTSPDYLWMDRGLILRSTADDDFNAIDPNYIVDVTGQAWLAFGSFWGGIKMRSLDAETGKLSMKDTKLYSLASRARPKDAAPARSGLPADWQAVEAPFVIRHGKFYYLFVSWDLCCRGTHSTYKTMVGRASAVTGPYIDKDGKSMAEGGGSVLLEANKRWLGPGGESAFQQAGQQDLLVFHAYDAVSGKPSMQISTIGWKDGWPLVTIAE
jgi:arabinan endo-1,5-alpha-L-arabinosidase